MAEDVSNKTVLVLVVLTILISTLGTFTVTSSVKDYQGSQVPVYDGVQSQTGDVSLKINNPNVQDQKTFASSPATGNVVFVPIPGNK